VSTIERAEVFVASPSRNFVTLRITTSDGVTDLGDATFNGRELAVASYLRDHVARCSSGATRRSPTSSPGPPRPRRLQNSDRQDVVDAAAARHP